MIMISLTISLVFSQRKLFFRLLSGADIFLPDSCSLELFRYIDLSWGLCVVLLSVVALAS